MERVTLKKTLLRAFFWFVLTYTAVSSTIVWVIQLGFMPTSPRQVFSFNPPETQNTMLSEVSFAEQYAREYFFWTSGKEATRVERLKGFMAPQVSSQGGLSLEKAQWDSYASYVNTWEVKDHPRNPLVKEVTVYAETVMTKVDQPEEQKRVNRYVVIPIQRVGSTYIVVDTPYLIPAPVATKLPVPVGEIKKGEPVSDKEYVQIENFAKSFLKVYTTGEAEEIGYFLKNKQSNTGLTSVLRFVELKNLVAYREERVVRAECDVAFEDLQSGASLLYHMRLMLEKDGTQWFVLKIEQGGI